MTGEDAEPTPASPGPEDVEAAQPKGRRQRAVDLFSPHRYRALQLSAFERRFRAQTPEHRDPTPSEAWGYPVEDDAVDPPLDSSAPAAVAARAHLAGEEPPHHVDPLEPVPWPDAEDTVDLGLPDEDFRIPEEGEPWPQDRQFEGLVTTEELSIDAVSDDVPDGETAPKSGRNMSVATVVGVGLLALAVGAAWLSPLVFAIVLYAFTIGALVEWKRALEKHGRRIPLVPLIAATVGMGIATWFAKPEGLVVALLVGCAGVVAWRLGDERVENTLADALAGVLSLLWIPFLASFLLLLELADDGWLRVILVVLAVVANDTGALVAGMRFGRRKLLERVSPKKTWEGAIGGVALGVIVASIAAYFFFDGEWYIGTAIGFACSVAGVVGDLAESALKRDIHIKDMSSVIPGHGGILDRIDSLLFAAPVAYVVFAIFLGTLGGGGL